MRLRAIAIIVTCLATASPPSWALCMGSSLEQVIGWSKLILVGTVHTRDFGVPWCTRYGLNHVRYIKVTGSPPPTGDTLSLIQDGNWNLWVEDQPIFEVGKRYVIFVARDTKRSRYTAMACVDHYVVTGIPDSPDSSIWSSYHRRLAGFDGRHMVWMMNTAWTPGDRQPWDPGGSRGDPPPQRPLSTVYHLADSMATISTAGPGGSDREGIQQLWLYPHQDPGTPFGEAQFVAAMQTAVERICPNSTR
jgi:hypothetical protein